MICSFFGHKQVNLKMEGEDKLTKIIERLIVAEKINTFYFGGFSEFDHKCWEIVSKFKNEKYKNINRKYCLSDPRHQNYLKRPALLKDEDYEEFIYLTLTFDNWYTRLFFRNCAMIDDSDFVIFYIQETKNSGAYKALQYAVKKKKKIIYI